MSLKYVIFELTEGINTIKVPFIFARTLSHADVLEFNQHYLRRKYNVHSVEAVSAGFVNFGEGVKVFGESESTGLSHDPDDWRVIKEAEQFNSNLDMRYIVRRRL